MFDIFYFFEAVVKDDLFYIFTVFDPSNFITILEILFFNIIHKAIILLGVFL